MAWIILVLAGLLEICWAIGLKYTEGFSRPWLSLLTLSAALVSLWLLALALKSIPVGIAYSFWVGIGVAGTAICGMVLFGEAASIGRILSTVLILAGIAGLKFTTP